eukprot:g65118.t1
MMEFKKAYKVPVPYTRAGDSQTSGNGPLMRAAPVPIFYASCSEDCVRYAYLQSRATHQGHEAAECSMLLAYVLWKLVSMGYNPDQEEEMVEHGKYKRQ